MYIQMQQLTVRLHATILTTVRFSFLRIQKFKVSKQKTLTNTNGNGNGGGKQINLIL